MPAMLVDIIAEIIALEPDLTFVDSISDSTELKTAVRRARADVVITQSLGDELAAHRPALLPRGRPLKTLATPPQPPKGLLPNLRPNGDPPGPPPAEGRVAAI